jgi:hypothetical protein
MSFRCRVIRGLLGLAWRWWGPAALIAVWLWWIWVGRVPRVVAPRPTDVALEFLHPAWLLDALLSTLWLTLVGAVLGLLGGTLLAVACWWFSSARPMIMTPAILTQLIPVVVFIPILGRLVGFGTPSVLAIAVLSGFFPSLVFVDSGLSSVPRARGPGEPARGLPLQIPTPRCLAVECSPARRRRAADGSLRLPRHRDGRLPGRVERSRPAHGRNAVLSPYQPVLGDRHVSDCFVRRGIFRRRTVGTLGLQPVRDWRNLMTSPSSRRDSP